MGDLTATTTTSRSKRALTFDRPFSHLPRPPVQHTTAQRARPKRRPGSHVACAHDPTRPPPTAHVLRAARRPKGLPFLLLLCLRSCSAEPAARSAGHHPPPSTAPTSATRPRARAHVAARRRPTHAAAGPAADAATAPCARSARAIRGRTGASRRSAAAPAGRGGRGAQPGGSAGRRPTRPPPRHRTSACACCGRQRLATQPRPGARPPSPCRLASGGRRRSPLCRARGRSNRAAGSCGIPTPPPAACARLAPADQPARRHGAPTAPHHHAAPAARLTADAASPLLRRLRHLPRRRHTHHRAAPRAVSLLQRRGHPAARGGRCERPARRALPPDLPRVVLDHRRQRPRQERRRHPCSCSRRHPDAWGLHGDSAGVAGRKHRCRNSRGQASTGPAG